MSNVQSANIKTAAQATYPRDVAQEVCLRRPDLCASDAVAVTLMQNPNLTADEVIEILDDAAEEYAQEQASQ